MKFSRGGSTDGTIEFMRENNFKVIVQNQIKIHGIILLKNRQKLQVVCYKV